MTPVTHPSWCDRTACSVHAQGAGLAGSHVSRSTLVDAGGQQCAVLLYLPAVRRGHRVDEPSVLVEVYGPDAHPGDPDALIVLWPEAARALGMILVAHARVAQP